MQDADEFGFEDIGLPEGATADIDQVLLGLEQAGQVQPRNRVDMSAEAREALRRAGEEGELRAAQAPALVPAPQLPSEDDDGMGEEEEAKRRKQGPPLQEVRPPQPTVVPPGMEALASLLDSKFAEQNAANEKTFKTTLKQVVAEEVGPVKASVKVLQTEQQRQGEELKKLQATVTQLQAQRDAGYSESGRSLGSEGSTRAGSGFGRAAQSSFVPSFILIKGWGNADPQLVVGRGSRNLDEANAHKVIAILLDDLAKDYETTDGQKNDHVFNREDTTTFNSNKPWGLWQIRIFIKSTVSRNTVWEIRNLWKRKIEEKYGPLAAADAFGTKINGRMTVTTEVEPHKQPQSSAAHRLIAKFSQA